jgi:hypothetical protein
VLGVSPSETLRERSYDCFPSLAMTVNIFVQLLNKATFKLAGFNLEVKVALKSAY